MHTTTLSSIARRRRSRLLSRTLRAALLVIATAMPGAAVHAEPDATKGAPRNAEAEAVEIQRGRVTRVLPRGQKVHYTNKWNLDGLPAYQPETEVTGIIRIWGENYLTDGFLGQYWDEGFRKFHPGARISYFTPTTVVALPGLYTQQADIGAGQKATWHEVLGFQRIFGYHALEINVATGSFNVAGWHPALAIYVQRDNPLTGITMKQLDGIFGAQRNGGWNGVTWDPSLARGPEGNIRTWGQLGLTGKWKNKPIQVYSRALRYQSTTIGRIVKDSDKWNETLREYSHVVRPDGTTALSATTLVQDLGKDPYGIGWADLMAATPDVKALPIAIDDDGPYAELNIENVRNRTYPLYGERFFYVNHKPGTPLDPRVREFIRYVLSREGQSEIMRDGKYLPLTDQIVAEQRKKLD